jgi:hypothetical protein
LFTVGNWAFGALKNFEKIKKIKCYRIMLIKMIYTSVAGVGVWQRERHWDTEDNASDL